MNRAYRRGGALVHVLVAIGVAALIVTIALQAITRARMTSGRVPCAANLKTIGQAMLLYAQENKGQYPRTLYVPGAPPTFHWDDADRRVAINPFTQAPWSGYANDAVMAMFLLVRTQDISTGVFICPQADGAKRDKFFSAANKASFSGPVNLSYSFANAYPDTAAAWSPNNESGLRWDTSLSHEYALAADQNPGIGNGYDVTEPADYQAPASLMKRANSRNNSGAGQNVLYGDGHVNFESNPFCGTKRDNIYTVSGSVDGTVTTSKVVVGSPRGGHDSVLLPVAAP